MLNFRYLVFVVLFSFIVQYASAQSPVVLTIGSASGSVGETICLDVLVDGFENASSMEWFNRWDPNVIRFDTIYTNTSALNDSGQNLIGESNFNFLEGSAKYGKLTWYDTGATGVTIPDGSILYSICFEIIGDPCETSEITLTGGDNEILFESAILGTDSTYVYPLDQIIINPGVINVESSGFVVSESHCSSDDTNPSGSITFGGSGGNGPYTWNVMGNGVNESNDPNESLSDCETATVSNLGPGTYLVEIIDFDGNTQTKTITIQENSAFPFTVDLLPQDPTCFDKNNGVVSVNGINGGDGPFTYAWSNSQFSNVIEDLFSGTYALTITDTNGCTTSSSTILSVDTLKVDIEVVSSPSCNGGNDGQVRLTASGGTPTNGNRYEYDVEGINGLVFFGDSPVPVPNNYTLTNYPAGCFEVTVTDDLNCVSDPVQFCLDEGDFDELTIIENDITCNNACDGKVEVSLGSAGNFTFQLTDANDLPIAGVNTNVVFNAENLCPGKYKLKVTDVSQGCSKDTAFTITQPDILDLIVIDSLGPGCGGGDGMISFNTTGGTLDYDYTWSDGGKEASRENMGGGDYSVTVVDANGCRDSIAWRFAPGGNIGLNGFVCQAVSCLDAQDGSLCADVSVSGNYTFSWEDENKNPIGQGAKIDNIGGGIYYVTATDGQCTAVDTVVVAYGSRVEANITVTSPSCPNSADGRLEANLVVGISPAMYEWSLLPSSTIVSSNSVVVGGVGEYNLHITDATGCESDTIVKIEAPADSISIDVSNIVGVNCFGMCNGGAQFIVTGGPAATNMYSLFVNNVEYIPVGGVVMITDLCGGINNYYATDGICSSTVKQFDVPEVDPIEINDATSMIENPACMGDQNGSILAMAQGGDDSAYDYVWINESVVGNSLVGLTAGKYFVSITDAQGCSNIDSVILIDPDLLTVNVDIENVEGISCGSSSNGQIGLSVIGGNPGENSYTWTPNVSIDSVASNLVAGNYFVTVTDSKGCTAETSYELTSAPQIVIGIEPPEEPGCYGEQTCVEVSTVSGGVGSTYTMQINRGPSLSIDSCYSVFAGEYFIEVFDSTGCSSDTTITIGQPDQVIVDAGPDITVDLGESSDPISVFIVSGFDTDSITWTPFEDIECNTTDCQVVTFTPSDSRIYTVTVVDENGCTASDEISVSVDLTRNVFLPNAFSPNGDNNNDFFQIGTGSGVSSVNYLKIFDRWGNRVYIDQEYMPNDTDHKGWDGTKDGNVMETGVYVFFAEVTFEDGVKVIYKGDVTLIR